MQRIVKRTFLVGGALALLCAGLAGCGSTKAKSWTFTDDEGSIRNLSDYEGQVLVLGFSNTWCEPCQEAALQMQSIQDRFRDQGVKVMTVSCWERGDADAYMQEHGYNYGVMLNGTKIAREYDVRRGWQDPLPLRGLRQENARQDHQVGPEAPRQGRSPSGTVPVDRRARRLIRRDDGDAARMQGNPGSGTGLSCFFAACASPGDSDPGVNPPAPGRPRPRGGVAVPILAPARLNDRASPRRAPCGA
ncbi:MAG: peroxiredoxin family protein [Planctomycetota bacterium]|jgi:thiol-disulfide isomerase/thioredoxin